MTAKKDDEFLIVNRRSGKALQATGLENGRPVCQAEITRSDAQVWYSTDTEGGITLTNKAASKVLDVMYSGKEDGTWAQTWENLGSESQVWKLTGRTYKMISHVASGKVLDIESMSDEDGAHAQLWENLGGENQQWKLEPLVEKTPETKAVNKPAAKKTAVKKQTPVKKSTAAKTAEKQVKTEKKPKAKPAPKAATKAATKKETPAKTATPGTAEKAPKKTDKKTTENEA